MKHRRVVFGLLVAALAVRASYLHDLHGSPLFERLVLDEANYDEWALRIAGGDVLGEGTFTANPLGPYMLGLLYAVVGRDLLVVRGVQMVVGAGSCFLIYRLALNLFGPRPALMTLALAAFYGPMIFTSANLVAESWTVLFVAAALVFLTEPRATRAGHLISGALVALAALGRPNLLLLVPVMPVAWALAARALPTRTKVGFCCLWLAGTAAVLTPVLLRNVVRGGEAVLITAHGGVNLWIGNNPDADGFFKTPVGSGLAGGQETLITTSIDVAEKATGHTVTPSEASRWWETRALDFALQQPLAFLTLTATKLGWYLNAYEPPLERNYAYGVSRSSTLRWATVGYGVVGPLALLGMVAAGARARALALPYIFAAVYSGSVVLYFVAMRYRIPVLVVFLPFAGLAISTLVDVVAGRAWRAATGHAVVLALLVALFHRPVPDGMADRDTAFTEHHLGTAALDAGDPDGALAHLEEAVRLFPKRSAFYNNLGLAYIRLDRPGDAVDALEEGIALGTGDRHIYRNLATARLALGQSEAALDAYRKAAKASPGHAGTRFNVAAALERLHRFDEAREEYVHARTLTKDAKLRERIDARLEALSEITMEPAVEGRGDGVRDDE